MTIIDNLTTKKCLPKLVVAKALLVCFIVASLVAALVVYTELIHSQGVALNSLADAEREKGFTFHLVMSTAMALHAHLEGGLEEAFDRTADIIALEAQWALQTPIVEDYYLKLTAFAKNFTDGVAANISHPILDGMLDEMSDCAAEYQIEIQKAINTRNNTAAVTLASAEKTNFSVGFAIGGTVLFGFAFIFIPIAISVYRFSKELELQTTLAQQTEQQLKDVTKNLNDAILQRFQALVHLRPVFEDAVSKAQSDFFGFIRLGFYHPHAKRAFEHLQTLIHRRSQELENLQSELGSSSKYSEQLALFKPILEDHNQRHVAGLQRTGVPTDALKKQWNKDRRQFREKHSVKLQGIIGSILPILQKNHLLEKIFLRFSLFEVGRAESLRFVLNRDLHEGKALALDGVDRVTLFGKRFYNLLKKEHSTENWDFYRAVEEFRHLLNKNQVPIRGEEIYKRFIAQGAPDAINLDSGTKQKTDERVQAMINDQKPWKQTVFDEAQAVIVELMASDPYKRFIRQVECAELYQSLKKEEGELKIHLVPLFKFGDKLRVFVTVHAEQAVNAGNFELAQEFYNDGMRIFERVGNVCLPEADALLASCQHELLRIQEYMARQDFSVATKRNEKLIRMMDKLRKTWITELLQLQDKPHVPPLLPLLKVDAIHRLEKLSKAVERCLRDNTNRNAMHSDISPYDSQNSSSGHGTAAEGRSGGEGEDKSAENSPRKNMDSVGEKPDHTAKKHPLRMSGFFKSRVQRDEDEEEDDGGVVSLLSGATEKKGTTVAERLGSFEVLEMTAEQIRHSRMEVNDVDGSKGSKSEKTPLQLLPRSLDTSLPVNTSVIVEVSPTSQQEPSTPLAKNSCGFRQMTPSKFEISDQVVADYYIKPLLSVRNHQPATPSSSGYNETSPLKSLNEREAAEKKGPLQQAAAMFRNVMPSFNSGGTSSQVSTPDIPLQSLLFRGNSHGGGLSSSGRMDDSVLDYSLNSTKLELTSIKDHHPVKIREVMDGYPIVGSRSSSLILAEEKDGTVSSEPSPQNTNPSPITSFGVIDPSKPSNTSFISTSDSSNEDLQFTPNPLESRDLSTTLSSIAPSSSTASSS